MKKLIFPIVIMMVNLSVISQPTFAFGKTGHRITGKIAEFYLSDESRKRIEKLIPTESLAEISTYADEMRSNPSEFWQKTAGPYHYATVPDGYKYAFKNAPPQGDVITAIKKYSKVLVDKKSSIDDQKLALKLIVHFIGDLHQPLHVGNGRDRGGNDFSVIYFGNKTNLHAVWDSKIIDDQQLSYSEWADWLNKKISAEDLNHWKTTDTLIWLNESQEMRDLIYPENKNIGWQYQYQHLPKIKQRLSQAGVRLAHYLNYLFEQK